jgi:hypothetical protein
MPREPPGISLGEWRGRIRGGSCYYPAAFILPAINLNLYFRTHRYAPRLIVAPPTVLIKRFGYIRQKTGAQNRRIILSTHPVCHDTSSVAILKPTGTAVCSFTTSAFSA